MKKLIIILISIMLLMSCNASIKIIDKDGWEIFQCGWTLSDNQVLIQSHEGYIIDNIYYTEHIGVIYKTNTESKNILIENRLERKINVKLTYKNTIKWVEIDGNCSYLIEA